jgi:hypothetical protein
MTCLLLTVPHSEIVIEIQHLSNLAIVSQRSLWVHYALGRRNEKSRSKELLYLESHFPQSVPHLAHLDSPYLPPAFLLRKHSLNFYEVPYWT